MTSLRTRFGRLPIRLKLVVIIVSISTTALLGSLVLETAFSWQVRQGNITRRLDTTADIISLQSRAALEFLDPVAAKENLQSLAADPSIYQACLYDEAGNIFAAYHTDLIPTSEPCPPAGRVDANPSWKERRLFKDIHSNGRKLGSIYLSYDLSRVITTFEQETGIRFLIIVLLMIFVWAISAYLQRLISLPIIQLADLSRRFGRTRDADTSGITHSDDEIGELVDAFRVMTTQIKHNELRLEEVIAEVRSEKDRAEEANRAKSEFLANMSHEIRTPMNAVIGLANILTMTPPLTPKQKEYLTTLLSSADSLLVLINDLLDVSKLEEGSIQFEEVTFDLVELAKKVITMAEYRAREKGVDVFLDSSGLSQRQFIGDPLRIQQIVTNLVSNAVKFTAKGSVKIVLSAKSQTPAAPGTVTIQVIDTGIGIAAEKARMIFEKFTQADASTTRKYGGTGLGLAISKALAEQMGGTIQVVSHLGQGSTFSVTLPLPAASGGASASPPVTEAADAEEKLQTGRSGGAPILLVEDYTPNIIVASAMLNEFGYECDVALDGKSAVAKFKAHPYALVLMDVQMPGMDGMEATRLIREFERKEDMTHTPIVAITAFAFTTDKEDCLASGMDDYISKPFDPETLRRKLVKWLSVGQEADASI